MIEFKNETRMKRYLNHISESKITEEDFQNCKDYLSETLEFIKETRENQMLIREGASLTIDINNEEYEVWVTYDNVIKDGETVTLIDFNYKYDDFIDTLPMELKPY